MEGKNDYQDSSIRDVLTMDQVMDILKVKRTTMYKLLRQPDGPEFMKLGKRRLITRKSLLEWVERHAGDVIF